MTGILQAILSFFGVAPAAAANYIEDVFSTYLYTGTGSSQTITNNIDTSTKGGLVWIKGRSGATGHRLTDTVRGATKSLESNSILVQATESTGLTAFGTTGFTIGADADYNTNAATYVSWTFREQAKFFDIVTYTGNGANRTISHNLGSVPGCIIIKSTDIEARWSVYHRSLGNTKYIRLDSTAAEDTVTTFWNSTDPTSTVFSIGTNSIVNANGGTYVAYLFAHDAGGFGATGTDNVISCGSFTTDGSENSSTTLGYEPQWLLIKKTNAAQDWYLADNMRGLNVAGQDDAFLYPNLSSAEGLNNRIGINSTGFTTSAFGASSTFIYIAIRRGPMKTPTSGTSVFSPQASASAQGTILTTNFPLDLQISKTRSISYSPIFVDRLRGVESPGVTGAYPYLESANTNAEATLTNITQDVDNTGFDIPGFYDSTSASYWNFRRAPGFFDVVCYTGTGANTTITHNLTVAPELIIVKKRQVSSVGWLVYSAALGATERLALNLTDAKVTTSLAWNNTAPTSTVFSLGTATEVNGNTDTFVAYLFATVAGVSKVGSYTGTGTTKQIDCGFTAGARFVMIKRTDSTGDWYVWDSARGIVAGNDPYLLLNSTAAEVTNTDYVDTSNAGFEISSTAPAAINANGGTYIFLAIA